MAQNSDEEMQPSKAQASSSQHLEDTDNKVIDEDMRQLRKQIARWRRDGNAVIKRGCVLCWPDNAWPNKAMCSSEVCRARTRAAAAHEGNDEEGNDTKSAEDSSASLEGFNLSCVDNVLDSSVGIGTKSGRRKINGSCGSSTKA